MQISGHGHKGIHQQGHAEPSRPHEPPAAERHAHDHKPHHHGHHHDHSTVKPGGEQSELGLSFGTGGHVHEDSGRIGGSGGGRLGRETLPPTGDGSHGATNQHGPLPVTPGDDQALFSLGFKDDIHESGRTAGGGRLGLTGDGSHGATNQHGPVTPGDDQGLYSQVVKGDIHEGGRSAGGGRLGRLRAD